MNETLELLQRMSAGDESAEARLYTLVHEELHERAQRMMRNQAPAHTLQATALVNEAWIKLSRLAECSWEDRAHFLNMATRAMQSVLVDHARAKLAEKRGGDRARLELDPELRDASDPSWRMLALSDALDRLGESQPEQQRVAQLRIFGGLSHGEIARLMGSSTRTIERHWSAAREVLREAL